MLTCVIALLVGADPYAAAREAMVRDTIEARGVRNPAVLRAMRNTLRHLFVSQQLADMAYLDQPLPIGYGATISQPYIVALMTELLSPGAGSRVLEIGTGSGYQAAILAQLAARVYTIEIVPELAASAAARLQSLGYRNVTVKQGDGFLGWPGEAPFDRIILTAAPAEVPPALIDQLTRGGKLVAPVGGAFDQELVVLEKDAAGRLSRHTAGPVVFVRMKSGEKPKQ
ncbi:MAG: protein-L-isoaspartate(D-aspartate) O-methyltransferase [Bryobacteraceae bacterium]|jgi:protein-L-isoaspartate(D-aspartate) O-methyltransferase